MWVKLVFFKTLSSRKSPYDSVNIQQLSWEHECVKWTTQSKALTGSALIFSFFSSTYIRQHKWVLYHMLCVSKAFSLMFRSVISNIEWRPLSNLPHVLFSQHPNRNEERAPELGLLSPVWCHRRPADWKRTSGVLREVTRGTGGRGHHGNHCISYCLSS